MEISEDIGFVFGMFYIERWIVANSLTRVPKSAEDRNLNISGFQRLKVTVVLGISVRQKNEMKSD